MLLLIGSLLLFQDVPLEIEQRYTPAYLACRALANPDLDADWRSGDVSACLLGATVRRTMWLERVR